MRMARALSGVPVGLDDSSCRCYWTFSSHNEPNGMVLVQKARSRVMHSGRTIGVGDGQPRVNLTTD